MLWLLALVVGLFAYDGAVELGLFLVVLCIVPVGLVLTFTRNRSLLLGSLRRSQQQVAVMAGSADAMLWECDLHGNLTFASDRLAAHFGYQPHETDGLNLRALIHPQELEHLGGLLALGSGWQQERWRCLHKDGSERWFSGSAAPNHAADGTLSGFIGSSHPLGQDALDEQRRSALAESIHQRLASGEIQPAFQPILSVKTGRLVGAEALSRFPRSDRNPEQWFVDAAEVGLAVELELAALRTGLASAHDLPGDIYISVNVSPLTLSRPALLDAITAAGISPHRIVLEVTEHASIIDYDTLLPAVHALRALGIRLAVDDAGAGYASFRHILRLAPEFIKLDRSLITDIHLDRARRALAAAVVGFGLEMKATIIAEGVETPEELRCAQDLGIDAAQGYLFGRPTGDWTTLNEWHRRGPLYSVTATARTRTG